MADSNRRRKRPKNHDNDHDNDHDDNREQRLARVTVDLSRIDEQQFEPDRPLRVATIRDGEVLDEMIVTPAEQKQPQQFEVELDLGEPVDGVAGANVVIAPADDERNLHTQFTARKFVHGTEARVDAGSLVVHPHIYGWWRFCWFPRTYRVTGRVVRPEADCTHPVGAAVVEVYDVDYCWWWYDEDLIASATTDANGYFEIEFTWCVPLWCLFRRIPRLPYIDPDLRDLLLERLERIPIPLPEPFPRPDDPWAFENLLDDLNIRLPQGRQFRAAEENVSRAVTPSRRAVTEADFTPITRMTAGTQIARADVSAQLSPELQYVDWREVFGPIIVWPTCDDPCDWRPDLRLRVTQSQAGGTVEIYRELFWDIHWNQEDDLLNLTLEANADAIHADGCQPDPPLGNCMLFERAGNYDTDEIYQPDLSPVLPGAGYGTTPSDIDLLGRTAKGLDRPWCETINVHGEFGLAAQVDYYQVHFVRWTAADIANWVADPSYTPPSANYSALSPSVVQGFVREYFELQPGPVPDYDWKSEPFAPQTIGGIPGLFKSCQRFEQEYEAAHGGSVPAPDFGGGWFWKTTTMTRLFRVRSGELADGIYTFRLVGYTQTGTDADGQPVLAPVDQGLPGGVLKRCVGNSDVVLPELITLDLVNDPTEPVCGIKGLWRQPATGPRQLIDECAIVVLGPTDKLIVEFEASDAKGNLGAYSLRLRRGSGGAHNVWSHSPPIVIAGLGATAQDGPGYGAALGQGATRPVWNGGSWEVEIPASFLNGPGWGSCAYDLELDVWNRHTDGVHGGSNWGPVHCGDDRAFTLILAADRDAYCELLDCCDDVPGPVSPGALRPGG